MSAVVSRDADDIVYSIDVMASVDQLTADRCREREVPVARIIPFPGRSDGFPRPDESRFPRLFLQAVGSTEPVRATAKGNLPVVVVKELFAGAFADAEPEFVRVNREDHSMVLSRALPSSPRLSFRMRPFFFWADGAAPLALQPPDVAAMKLMSQVREWLGRRGAR